MFAPTQTGPVPRSYTFRWLARASAAVLTGISLTLLMSDVIRPDFNPTIDSYWQAACLAIVFAGYAIGLRKELAGGIAAIVGTLAFFAVVLTTIGDLPGVAAVLFAIPGVLYLLAWHYDERRRLWL